MSHRQKKKQNRRKFVFNIIFPSFRVIKSEMMMDSIADPFLNLYNDGQIPSIPESLLFSNDDTLGGFDLDLPITSPNKFEQETISNMTENPGNKTIIHFFEILIFV